VVALAVRDRDFGLVVSPLVCAVETFGRKTMSAVVTSAVFEIAIRRRLGRFIGCGFP
jgi:hypothetical protein